MKEGHATVERLTDTNTNISSMRTSPQGTKKNTISRMKDVGSPQSTVLSSHVKMEESKQVNGRKGFIPPPLTVPELPSLETSVLGKGKACALCERSFTVFRAKHTCKLCLARVCDECSRNRMKLNRRLERRKGSRLCNPCARNNLEVLTVTSPPAAAVESKVIVSTSNRMPTTDDIHSSSDVNTVDHSSETDSLRYQSKSVALGYSNQFQEPVKTHLRTRHWISFGAWMCLLLIKSNTRNVESLWMISLSSVLDQVVTFRVITSYLLGLVLYDEVLTRTEHRYRATSRPHTGTQVSQLNRNKSRTMSNTTVDSNGMKVGRISSIHDDEEILEVEVGDRVTEEETDGFRFDKMLLLLRNCTSTNRVVSVDGQTSQLRMSSFLAMSDTICGFINCFGGATSFAASTVSGYIGTIGTNLAGWPVPLAPSPLLVDGIEFSWKEQSVRSVVEREVDLQIAASGGKKKPSCARCVLRLVWFAEFVEACIRYALIENKEENCSNGACKAYEETIGTRHPWIIRKGVMSAMSSLPTRSTILRSLKLYDLSSEEIEMNLQNAQNQMKMMLEELKELLQEYQLMDIK